ncbi:MAG TPA: hypothetical protein VIK65_14235 [Candidatus Limnocylindrales bacterium]
MTKDAAKARMVEPSTTARAVSRPRLIALLAVVVAIVAVIVAAVTVFGGPGRRVETGVVVAVQATSLSSVEGFSIRTEDGRTVDFRVGTIEDATQFPPGHLAEHKVSFVPVRVTYVQQGGALVAVRLEDAP